MNLDQVSFLNGELNKDNGSGKTVAKSIYYGLDNNVAFRNSHDFVFFDNDKQLIHCISANRNNNVKDEAPYTLMTADYSQLQFMESNFDIAGLKTILDSAICTTISADQKKAIMKWAQLLPIHPLNPNVGLDYYKFGETAIPQKPVTEDDAKTEAASHEPIQYDYNWASNLHNSVTEFALGIPERNSSYTSVAMNGSAIDVVTNSTDNLEVGLTEFLATLELDQVKFVSGDSSYTMVIDDTSTYNTFKEGVINFMPTVNNASANATITGTSGSRTAVYTLKVKYYNSAEDNCEVDGVCYSSLNNAIASVGSTPSTILLKNDISEDVVIPVGADITLNLGGKTLTNKTVAHVIENKGTLTVTGTGKVSATQPGRAAVANHAGAVATLSGGEFDSVGWYVLKNLGTMTIDGGVTVCKPEGSTDVSSLIDNGWVNGSASSASANDLNDAHSGEQVATLTISDGNFSGVSGQSSCSIVKNDDFGVLNISGGTFDSTNNSGTSDATTILNWNSATISGGTFSGSYPLSNGKYAKSAIGNAGEMVVTGGTFNGTNSLFGVGNAAADPTAQKGLLTIENGTFNATQFWNGDGTDVYDIVISGGSFGVDPTTYLAEGYKAELQDSMYVVSQETVEEQVDDIIDGLTGVDVVKDESAPNTYSITSVDGTVSDSGLFDQIAALSGLTSITVVAGETTVTYNAGDDLDAFKASVDALGPTSNDDPAVVMTMTVVCE